MTEPSARLLLGWNVGGTSSSAIVATDQGKIVERKSWQSAVRQGPQRMIDQFVTLAMGFRERYPLIQTVGVSIGGPLDPIMGVIHNAPHLPGWDGIPLKELLENALQLPVKIEHDAVACLIAEYLWGAARSCTHAVYFTAGTGFGAGVMIDGRIIRGPKGQSTEIGHVRLADEGPFLYGKHGSVEAFCSGTGISLLANNMFPDEFPYPANTPELYRLSEEGSVKAKEVLLTAAKWTGRVCALFVDLFSPQMIVAGSMSRYLPSWWLANVRAECSREALSHHFKGVQIVPPGLGQFVQDLSSVGPCLFRSQEGIEQTKSKPTANQQPHSAQ